MSSTGAPPSSQQQAPTATTTTSKGLYWGALIGSILGTGTLLASLIYTAATVGSSDSWSVIKGKITGLLSSTIVGGIIFSIAFGLLILSRPSLSAWLPTIVSCIALTLSVSAVCIASISR